MKALKAAVLWGKMAEWTCHGWGCPW